MRLTDVEFITAKGPDGYFGMVDAFKQGRADAVLAGGAEGPKLRRLPKTPGHVILETMTEKPWSEYFCCTLVANRDWARQNPIATKRVTRALLRATDRAAKDQARAAHDAVPFGGDFADESIVRETMGMCTYDWRELDPEETLRFFALRLAPEFLADEGFTDVRFVSNPGLVRDFVTKDLADFSAGHPEELVEAIDAGVPVVAVAGLHSGCQEVWVGPGIASFRDLRGKRIAVFAKDTTDQYFGFFATTLAYVGIDPVKDVNCFVIEGADYRAMMDAFIGGRSDAFLAAGDGAAVLRRSPRSRSTMILDQTADKPWSQFVCCLLAANRDWTHRNPVATKRVVRAIMRAADAT